MNGISDRSASEMLVCTRTYNIVANDWRITFSIEACSLHKNPPIKNFAHFGYAHRIQLFSYKFSTFITCFVLAQNQCWFHFRLQPLSNTCYDHRLYCKFVDTYDAVYHDLFQIHTYYTSQTYKRLSY